MIIGLEFKLIKLKINLTKLFEEEEGFLIGRRKRKRESLNLERSMQ